MAFNKHRAKDLSIIIVTWNNAEIITPCIQSIIDNVKDINYEVIVVDNDSSDNTVGVLERLNDPRVKVINSGGNLGFSKGNNVGLEYAEGEYTLYLNPDTIILDDAINKTLEFIKENEDVGSVSCKILNADKSLQESIFNFVSVKNIIIEQFNLQNIFPKLTGKKGENVSREVDWYIGAYIMMRTSEAIKIGGFSEEYFMYCEDMDLCYKVRYILNKKNYYLSDSSIIHLGGYSEKQNIKSDRYKKILTGYLKFTLKFNGRKGMESTRKTFKACYQVKYGIMKILYALRIKDREKVGMYITKYNRSLSFLKDNSNFQF